MQNINQNDKDSELLQSVKNKIRFIPNIFKTISNSTPTITAFNSLSEQFSQTSLNSTENETIQLFTSVKNHCNYCVAGHTAFVYQQKVSETPFNIV